MRHEDKPKWRDYINNNGWTIIWRLSEMPCQFLDEEVELIYEDMDAQFQICEAIYTYDKNDTFYRTPYFKRKSDGARMVNCIAWRRLKS